MSMTDEEKKLYYEKTKYTRFRDGCRLEGIELAEHPPTESMAEVVNRHKNRFAPTPAGYRQAKTWLRQNELIHLIDKELSTDGFTIVALANKLYKDREER